MVGEERYWCMSSDVRRIDVAPLPKIRIVHLFFEREFGERVCLTKFRYIPEDGDPRWKLYFGPGESLFQAAVVDLEFLPEQGGMFVKTQFGSLLYLGEAYGLRPPTWNGQTVKKLDPELFDFEFIGSSEVMVRLKEPAATQG